MTGDARHAESDTHDQPASAAPAPRRRWFRWFVLITLTLFVIVYVAWRSYTSHLIATEHEAIRAAGYPVTLAELEAWHGQAPPGEPNAADLYIQAAQLAVKSDDVTDPAIRDAMPSAEDLFHSGFGMLSPAAVDALGAHATMNAEPLRLIREASAIEQCVYPYRPTTGVDAALGDISHVNACMDILRSHLMHCAHTGQAEQFVRGCEDIDALIRSLDGETIQIMMMARMVMQHLCIVVVEQGLTRLDLTDAQLQRLDACLRDDDRDALVRRALIGEQVLGLAMFNDPGWVREERQLGSEPINEFTLFRVSGLVGPDQLSYLKIMRRVIAFVDLPEAQRPAEIDAIGEQIDRLEFSRLHIVSSRALTPIDIILGADIKTLGKLRAARAAVAVKRYRLRHGDWPEALDVLTPDLLDAVPIDPWTAVPLVYRPSETGVMIYSVSDNGVDDGGARDAEGNPLDQVVRLKTDPRDVLARIETRLLDDPSLDATQRHALLDTLIELSVDPRVTDEAFDLFEALVHDDRDPKPYTKEQHARFVFTHLRIKVTNTDSDDKGMHFFLYAENPQRWQGIVFDDLPMSCRFLGVDAVRREELAFIVESDSEQRVSVQDICPPHVGTSVFVPWEHLDYFSDQGLIADPSRENPTCTLDFGEPRYNDDEGPKPIHTAEPWRLRVRGVPYTVHESRRTPSDDDTPPAQLR